MRRPSKSALLLLATLSLSWMALAQTDRTARFPEMSRAAEKTGLAEDFKGITHLQIHVHVNDLNSDEPFDPPGEYLRTLGKELKSRGIIFQVLPWECSDPRAYEKLLAIGAESFATDYPEVTLAAVKKFRKGDK